MRIVGRLATLVIGLLIAASAAGCGLGSVSGSAAPSPVLSFTIEAVDADAPFVSATFPRAAVDPALTTADSDVAQRAADAINTYVTSVMDEFGGSSEWLQDPKTNPDGRLGELRLTATQRVASEIMTLIALEGYEFTGGAHGLPLLHTIAFNPATGEQFTWADGITAAGMSVVSAEVRRQVAAQIGVDTTDEWLTTGSLEPMNVGLWWPAADGLHLTYQPYSLGPYAIGTPEVTIPWSLIEPYLVAQRPLRL